MARVRGDEIDRPVTVTLFLGPYRNLTTLTASMLSLHPECQVLNHGGTRLLRGRQDFIGSYSDARLDRFCASAIKASVGGKRGAYGGSIRLSHAFDSEAVSTLYGKRFGDATLKDHIACLVWKESQRVMNLIRSSPQKIHDLVEAAPRLRYLMPVRNPIDCALSNIRTGMAGIIEGADSTDLASVLDHILEEIAWFSRVSAVHPDRFFMFFQDDEPVMICDGLVRTLGISNDKEWRDDVSVAFKVRSKGHQPEPGLRAAFDESIRQHFDGLPEVAGRIVALVNSSSAAGDP
jgi:hypothetical protein